MEKASNHPSLALIGALLCLTGGVGAVSSGLDCLIENITIQSFFAIDGYYQQGNDEIIRNKIFFMNDIKSFFYQMETSKKGVDSFNGIFAFGDSIFRLQNFTDDTEGSIDLEKVKTTKGKTTVIDALEEIIDEFDDIPTPKTDYVRLGILITSRPLHFVPKKRSASEVEDDDDEDDENEKKLSAILSKISEENIIMYAIGKDSNSADLVRIVGLEDTVIINNFTDSFEAIDAGSKFKSVLCQTITENRILAALTVGAGAIAGIIIAIIAAAIILYVIKKHAYDKYQLQKLAEAKENLKNKSEANRLYKDPVTKTDLAELGVATT